MKIFEQWLLVKFKRLLYFKQLNLNEELKKEDIV
jgi:hypothetical protein